MTLGNAARDDTTSEFFDGTARLYRLSALEK
jgi:hypothetical protein